MIFSDKLVLVRGGGDLATGIIYRLHQAGFPVIVTEIAAPTAVRRSVAFAQAVFAGEHTVEDVTAVRVEQTDRAREMALAGQVPVLVDPRDAVITDLRPTILVDARLLKRPNAANLDQAPLVIGLGPGFTGGVNCHAAIETNRGHWLGRVLWDSAAQANTGIPGATLGFREERILRSPAAGVFHPTVDFGDHVEQGQTVGHIDADGASTPVKPRLTGAVRGLVHPGLTVHKGMKIGDVDPRDDPTYIYTISDKALAIGGAVLAAVLMWMNQ
jgi:xanthine dehydrogenase accessory factor